MKRIGRETRVRRSRGAVHPVVVAVLAALFLVTTVAARSTGQAAAQPASQERILSFFVINTGGRLTIAYRNGDAYIPEALEKINHVLRDPICGDVHVIDPGVLDFLYDLLQRLGYRGEVHIVCGYRSVETNAMLHKKSSSVVLGSQHIQGRALDFRLPGVDMKMVWETAKSMKRGGTGFYKASNFVHIDTGPVRFW
jgi:uncharacterized protein YcbK (DUF882 family)